MEGGVDEATVAFPPESTYQNYLKNRKKKVDKEASELEDAVSARAEELRTFVAEAVTSKTLQEGRKLTPELRDFALASVMREFREGIADAPLGNLYLTHDPPPKVTVALFEETTEMGRTSAVKAAIDKLTVEDGFLTDSDDEMYKAESLDSIPGQKGINYEQLKEDVQLLPCEWFERFRTITREGPLSEDGRKYIHDSCIRALTQGLVERLVYSVDDEGYIIKTRVIPRNEGRVKIVKTRRRKGVFPRYVRKDGKVVRLKQTQKAEGKPLAVKWLDPERQIGATYDDRSLMDEPADVLFCDLSEKGNHHSNNDLETRKKRKKRIKPKKVFKRIRVEDGTSSESNHVESDSELSGDQLSLAVNYVVRALDALKIGIDDSSEIRMKVLHMAEDIQKEDLREQESWDAAKYEGRQTKSRVREERRQETKPTFEEKFQVLKGIRIAEDERIQHERDIKNFFLSDQALNVDADDEDDEDDDDNDDGEDLYIIDEDGEEVLDPSCMLFATGPLPPLSVPQMEYAVDNGKPRVSAPLLEELEKRPMTKKECIDLACGEAFTREGLDVRVPAIATQGMPKVDRKRKQMEKRIGKRRSVWSLLNEKPPDASSDSETETDSLPDVELTKQSFVDLSELGRKFPANEQELKPKSEEQMKRQMKYKEAQQRKQEREKLVENYIEKTTKRFSVEERQEYKDQHSKSIGKAVLKFQNLQG